MQDGWPGNRMLAPSRFHMSDERVDARLDTYFALDWPQKPLAGQLGQNGLAAAPLSGWARALNPLPLTTLDRDSQNLL